jgi:hypothetical protein
VTLDGAPIGPPILISDQLNRVVFDIPVGSLTGGLVHIVTYNWRLSDLGCYRNTTNEVHLDREGLSAHLATSVISVLVNCNLP